MLPRVIILLHHCRAQCLDWLTRRPVAAAGLGERATGGEGSAWRGGNARHGAPVAGT